MLPAWRGHLGQQLRRAAANAVDDRFANRAADLGGGVDAMVEAAKRSELMEGVTEVLVPGEPEMRAREQNLREGVPLLPSTYHSLVEYAKKAGLETKLVEV